MENRVSRSSYGSCLFSNRPLTARAGSISDALPLVDSCYSEDVVSPSPCTLLQWQDVNAGFSFLFIFFFSLWLLFPPRFLFSRRCHTHSLAAFVMNPQIQERKSYPDHLPPINPQW
ncbi:hypothetical protein CEXT_55461 [Caerostris extrusa]|uniref:Uncharacterized protein n=1 Tax=Caerostris extrusa TaxID=172846 RepID=A0AAV4TA11_CAEEX|nr:hypothetical protein CEXT_55461 [Caerostris extrusa]